MPPVVQSVDERVLDFIARTDHGYLRPVLRTAAKAIAALLPWIAVSVRLAAGGSAWSRRAVGRGWVAMAIAAAVEDGVMKPLTGRRRPDAARLPPGERRTTRPSTSGFPSGHTGAATAFAAATRDDAPRLQPWLVATAVVVAYTQVYTGRHYPSDALVAVAIGAAAGSLVRRLPTAGGRRP